MIFKKKDRLALSAIKAQLEYQQKLLESMLEIMDAGEKQALKRKLAVKDYFSTLESVMGGVDSPALAPFKNALERLKND